MHHDEKAFLEQLQDYHSDDTKKARRNVSTIAFVVIAVHLLNVRLTDVKLFGVDLSHTSELMVLVLALALLAYWLLMFALSWKHDHNIQIERSILLQSTGHQLTTKLAEMEKIKKENAGYTPGDYGQVKAAVEVYERQKARTAAITTLGRLIRRMEVIVPTALTAYAGVVLIAGIQSAL